MDNNWKSRLGTSVPCECGRTHTVVTKQVEIGPGALERLPQVLERHATAPRGALIADQNTWTVAGEKVLNAARDYELTPIILGPQQDGLPLRADDTALAKLEAALPAKPGFLLSVGSGTVNDLTKLAATQLHVPPICVATAPSMNGYSSAIAAISRDGIKRTDPCTPPVAIVCDTDILSGAPAEMVQAGFADLLSKSTSSTDWLMGHLLLGEYYCRRPVEIAEDAERASFEQAAAIGRREPAALGVLISSLIQSGISMAMAGSSSPASGGEHLISHYWDMTAHGYGRESDLHGRQVAIGTLLAITLYEMLLERTRDGIDVEATLAHRPDAADLSARSIAHFSPLVGDGPAREIAALLLEKHLAPDDLRAALTPLTTDPAGFWARLEPSMRPSAELKRALRDAGVPTRAADIGIPREQVQAALIYARHIRARYTVLDLAADLGLLEGWVEQVMDRAEV